MTRRKYYKRPGPNQKIASTTPDIWKLPPYVIARFGGELTQIMLNAAQEYIVAKCLSQIRHNFSKELMIEQQ